MTSRFPRISTEGAERELYRLVPKVNLQVLEACSGVQLSQHGDGCHRVCTMHQYQVRLADGMGQLQQISDLPMGCGFLRCRELRWITHHPQDVELAQTIDV